jgi:hypothetical protein
MRRVSTVPSKANAGSSASVLYATDHGVKPDWALQITEGTSAVASRYGALATAVKTNGFWPKEGGRPVDRAS